MVITIKIFFKSLLVKYDESVEESVILRNTVRYNYKTICLL